MNIYWKIFQCFNYLFNVLIVLVIVSCTVIEYLIDLRISILQGKRLIIASFRYLYFLYRCDIVERARKTKTD